jgi:hypothetical protein
LTEYEKAFYEVLKNSQDAMNKAGITIPNIGSDVGSGEAITKIEATLPPDVVATLSENGVTQVKLSVHQADESNVDVAFATITDGKFTLNLPSTIQAELLMNINEIFGVACVASDNSAKWIDGKLCPCKADSTRDCNGQKCSTLWPQAEENNEWEILYVYVDKDVIVTNDKDNITTNDDGNIIMSVSLNLKKGWNVVYFMEDDKYFTTEKPRGLTFVWKYYMTGW